MFTLLMRVKMSNQIRPKHRFLPLGLIHISDDPASTQALLQNTDRQDTFHIYTAPLSLSIFSESEAKFITIKPNTCSFINATELEYKSNGLQQGHT